MSDSPQTAEAPPKKRVPKARFNSVDDVMEAIGKITRRIMRLRLGAEDLDAKARKEAKEGSANMARAYNDFATRKFDKARKLETGYLQHLKRKLAVMQTPLLPNVGTTDQSIPK